MKILFLFLMLFTSTSSIAADFSTPQSALKALEQAYIDKNIEAAVAAKNFYYEAKKLLESLQIQGSDEALIQKASSTLELAFRQQLQTQGFPKFSELKCHITNSKQLTADLVELSEKCTYPDGHIAQENIYAAKTNNRWGIVNLPPAKI